MNIPLFRGRKPLSANPTLNLTGAGIALIAVCYGLARFGYGFFTPIFRTEFSLSPTTIGFFASASYIAYCAAIIAATLLTTSLGARNLVIASGLLAAGSMAGIALAPNASALGTAVAATGFCTGLVSPPLATVIAENVAQKYQSRVQTMVNSGAGVGVVISVPIAMTVSSHWRLSWLLFAALALAATLWITRSAPRPLPRLSPDIQLADTGLRIRLLPRPAFPVGSIRLISASALLGASSTAMLTFGRDFLIVVGQQSAAITTTAWVMLGASGLVGAAAGSLSARFGLGLSWFFGCVSMSVASLVLIVWPNSSSLGLISMTLFGAAYTTSAGFLLVWCIQVYYRAQSVGVGMAFLVIALGQAIATPLFGFLMVQFGAAMPFYAAAACGLAAGLIMPRISVLPITTLMEIIPVDQNPDPQMPAQT
ncbi:MFS transporter [Glutamicibacter uratoxydans]|uniref:MFS transporter n=1 Tax=Glutamicibacter uratoxydans TaxID=43667 RepID=A0A4Y4DN16_GLUUR|nr:MFS transporter [Glutamicibacter uratoxydans]GED05055.1 MFS transporter [Glutamicibacter uratoxydans]